MLRPPPTSTLFPYTTLFRSDLTEDDFDFLTSNKVWIATDRSRNFVTRQKDRKSGSAGMPRPISYAVFCSKKKHFIKVIRWAVIEGVWPHRIPLNTQALHVQQ